MKFACAVVRRIPESQLIHTQRLPEMSLKGAELDLLQTNDDALKSNVLGF